MMWEFRKEIREFMSEVRRTLGKENLALREQRLIIETLSKQNEELHDRLMSRDYPELKTYDTSFVDNKSVTMDYDQDEENAGEVIDPNEQS